MIFAVLYESKNVVAPLGTFVLGAITGLSFAVTFLVFKQVLRRNAAKPCPERQNEMVVTHLSTLNLGTHDTRDYDGSNIGRDSTMLLSGHVRYELWAENIFTVLGAPFLDRNGRRLTLEERLEWLQAKNG